MLFEVDYNPRLMEVHGRVRGGVYPIKMNNFETFMHASN
jgi:hypothetical protein